MQTARPHPPRTRSIVWISIFALIVITLVLFGACNPTPDTSSRQAPATASPSPSPLGSPPIEADTPIVVKGGGSVDLDFNENIFPGATPKCATCKISSVTLEQIPPAGSPISSPTPVQCTFTGDPTISVETANGNDKVTIKGTSSGVEIDFNASMYPGIITSCGDARKHHSQNGVITGVKLNGQGCSGCTVFKRCKIEVTVSQ
ncbi:MAG TPA: hypothetical protein VLE19_05145 [Pyrinomonadaceae bacterium]|nr:hypothetical protein [Pyrinomonadaceae bacterium]